MSDYESDQEATSHHSWLTLPHVFLVRIIIFLILVGFLIAVLYIQIEYAFMSNPGLNGLIVTVLIFGIILSFRQILRLYPEVRWVNELEEVNSVSDTSYTPVMLAPLAMVLGDKYGRTSMTTQTLRSLMDSVGIRLDEAREISRYLIGLLVFLGLLGTFWGLLETINSVGQTIRSLNPSASQTALMFEELKAGLEAPLQGMGTAFSSSLFGLSGSLVLGFLDLQANQAQNRFYTELEDWLSAMTEITSAELGTGLPPSQLRFTLQDMQRNLDKVNQSLTNDKSQQDIENQRGYHQQQSDNQVKINQVMHEQSQLKELLTSQANYQNEISKLLKELLTKEKDKK